MAEYSQGFDGINMPYSLDAEQSVLGAILLDPSCISDESVAMLKPEHFYLPQNRVIFSAIYQMYAAAKPIDHVTILDQLRSMGDYEAAGGTDYLVQIAQVVPSTKNVKAYADTVIEKFYVRSLIQAGRDTVSQAQEGGAPASQLIDAAEQRLYNIRQGKDSTGLVKLKDVITTETFKRLSALSDPETRKEYKGIPTGFTDLDRVIGGLHKTDLVVIGARPGMGKTSFILNIAEHVAVKERKKVAFFSLEMSNDQLAQRLLSSKAAVEVKKMRDGNLNQNEWDRIVTATTEFRDAELYVDDTAATTVPQIKSKLRRNRPDVVFIDYLQLVESAGKRNENRVQQVSEITRDLKIMAKELQVPVIVCSQLSRNTDARGSSSHEPQLSDLRESGSIEQDADIVMFLFRPKYYNNSDSEDVNENEAKCNVAKNRHGATEKVPLYWDQRYTRFMNFDKEEKEY